MWEIRRFTGWKQHEADTVIITVTDADVFILREHIGLAPVAALAGLAEPLDATGSCRGVTEQHFIFAFEAVHVPIVLELEGRLAWRPGAAAAGNIA
ncbi:hypothetical protein EBZ80_09160, partial [bacterium]|nr:hypothetical protein [bacterium]